MQRKNNKKTAFSILELSIVILIIAAIVSAVIVNKANFFEKAQTNKMISATKNSVLKDMDGLALWYDVATDESFRKSEIVENVSVEEWKNIAPDNYLDMNFIEVTNPPTYKLDADDGLPMLSFSGGGDILTSDRSVFGYELAKNNQITIIFVNKHYSGSNRAFDWGVNGSERILAHGTHSDYKFYFEFGAQTGGRLTSVSSYADSLNEWKIITMITKSDDTGVVRYNGNLVTMSGSMVNELIFVNTDTFIMGDGVFDVRELIVFKRALSEQEIDDVEQYLSKKWDIELS